MRSGASQIVSPHVLDLRSRAGKRPEMKRSRTWYRGLATKIGGPLLLILVLSIAVAVITYTTVRSMSGHTSAIKLAGEISADVLQAHHWVAVAVVQGDAVGRERASVFAREDMSL